MSKEACCVPAVLVWYLIPDMAIQSRFQATPGSAVSGIAHRAKGTDPTDPDTDPDFCIAVSMLLLWAVGSLKLGMGRCACGSLHQQTRPSLHRPAQFKHSPSGDFLCQKHTYGLNCSMTFSTYGVWPPREQRPLSNTQGSFHSSFSLFPLCW